MITISNRSFDEERALYNLKDAQVFNCTFAGEKDGESVLKESSFVEISNCSFSLRYPLWHCDNFILKDCHLDNLTRAPIWYSKKGLIKDSKIEGIKCLRESSDIVIKNSVAISPEFCWRCENIEIDNCDITSEYLMFECKNVKVNGLKMSGKYSFQYVKDATFENCVFDTKDAFWHGKNITVKNSVLKGEYLGWYSENLTLINCEIEGTQPLCYCKNLKLIDCKMTNCDLSFEYSSVNATILGEIDSVKNVLRGKIVADKIGQVIVDDYKYKPKAKIIAKSGK
ncbi:MAG: DUF3737 family protein [Clostridia bacterium]|nr:DUF3737 family protein [Clostridia bacterium]